MLRDRRLWAVLDRAARIYRWQRYGELAPKGATEGLSLSIPLDRRWAAVTMPLSARKPETGPRASGVLAGLETGTRILKLPVNPSAKDIYRPAIGVVGGVGDELIVKGEVCRGGEPVAIIRFENLLEAGMR